jgi:hypothetical protein
MKKRKEKKIMEGQYYTTIRDIFSCFNTENEEKRLFLYSRGKLACIYIWSQNFEM